MADAKHRRDCGWASRPSPASMQLSFPQSPSCSLRTALDGPERQTFRLRTRVVQKRAPTQQGASPCPFKSQIYENFRHSQRTKCREPHFLCLHCVRDRFLVDGATCLAVRTITEPRFTLANVSPGHRSASIRHAHSGLLNPGRVTLGTFRLRLIDGTPTPALAGLQLLLGPQTKTRTAPRPQGKPRHLIECAETPFRP